MSDNKTKIKVFLVRFFYSCDGIKGLLHNPEDLLSSYRSGYMKKLGSVISKKKKKARLFLIEQVNSENTESLLISIVMPVYNSGKTIKNAILSIQNQRYQCWELLIIDDGSNDNLIESISTIIQQDERIKLLSIQENKGVSFARNIGLHYAKGDYVTFHDADDISHPERLEYQLSSLLKKPKSSVVIFQTLRVDSDGKLFIINGRKKWNRVSGMMFKRSMIDSIGYFKPLKISEDTEYYERILATYGKQSRCILCKTLYYALFSANSLLFSNAKVNVSKRCVDYKINEKELIQLEKVRSEHKLIASGELSPYQGFEFNKDYIKQVL